MASLKFLITAGPTREHLDPVRFLSNESSGRMGVALARAAAQRGHRVTLVHGPLQVARPANVTRVPVLSAAQMLAASRKIWPRCDVLLMCAAVADYTPARPSRTKIKKHASALVLRLMPTVDVLAELSAARKPGQVTIGFALEDRDARRNAADKLRRKRLDAIVLNSPAALGAESSQLSILLADGRWIDLPAGPKTARARTLVRLAESLHGKRISPASAPSGAQESAARRGRWKARRTARTGAKSAFRVNPASEWAAR